MALFDIPPIYQERVACSIMAAVKYEVPVNIVLAIAEKEGGKPGQWVKNTNGTFDVGAMQFNTHYLQDLKPYGIRAKDVATSGCYPYDLAAWRLRGHIKRDSQDIWTRAANYHSRTPKYNQIYRQDLIKKSLKWQTWLDKHFHTYAVTQATISPVKVKAIYLAQQKIPYEQYDKKTFPKNWQAHAALEEVFGQNLLSRKTAI